jgi:hypothetical protein
MNLYFPENLNVVSIRNLPGQTEENNEISSPIIIAGLMAEIRKKHFPNASQHGFHYANQFGVKTSFVTHISIDIFKCYPKCQIVSISVKTNGQTGSFLGGGASYGERVTSRFSSLEPEYEFF